MSNLTVEQQAGRSGDGGDRSDLRLHVTGAGSAGCVVAARLSESGRHRVLLLEAGPPDRNPWIHIPLGYARTYVDPAVNWKFETEPQPQLGNRRLYLPRGKTLGGSISINGMVYIRVNHGDYDEWRQRGCEGWDWDTVLPYFKRAQNQTRGADDFHGIGGPLHVSDQPGRFELADAVLKACVQAGIPARARGETIVSGGAYGSPQLLLLSGLGPAQHLQDMGITVVRDMPAVGSNLHDHFNSYVAWRCSKAITLNDLENSKLRKLSAGVRYALFRSGPMASNGIHAGVFTRTDPRLERPDVQLNVFEWSTLERGRTGIVPHPFPGFTISPVHLRPDGRGTVRLGSADPMAPPAVLFDYLRTDYDMQAVIFGIRLARKIAEQPALKPYVAAELQPGPAITSDAELATYVRESGVSNQHPTSSCAMGHGPNTVVDPRLRVHGIDGLRVADASIMPVAVGGNTNAPTIMIGEKAAAMILEDAVTVQRAAA